MKKFVHIILLLLSLSTNAQNKIFGEIYYDFNHRDSKITREKKSVLVFNDSISIFKFDTSELVTKKSGIQKNENGDITLAFVPNDKEGSFVYRNYNKKEIVVRKVKTKLLNGVYYKDNWKDISWQLIDDFKKIENYDCQKATCNFRGRNYTVWFTTKIPINFGPWKLYGLPGLILEAYDNDKVFYCIATKILLNSNKNNIKLPEPENDDYVLTYTEHKEFLKKVFQIESNKFKAIMPKGMTLLTTEKEHQKNSNPIELEWE